MDKISPKLIGDKVLLGPFRHDLNDTYRRWLHDLDNGFGLLPSMLLMHEQEEEWLRNNANPNQVLFTVYNKESEQPIGTVALVNMDTISRHAELGILIGEPGFKGKGFGSEAIKLVLDYGFNILNLESIYLRVHSYNPRAAALYERLGFKRVGARRHAQFVAGKYYDDIIMDMLKSEFSGDYIKSKLDKFGINE